MGHTHSWEEVWTGHISNDIHLIAVACENILGPGGLLVSMGNLLVSNTKWKCSGTAENAVGWYKVNFNDSAWDDSLIIVGNGVNSWQDVWVWYQADFPISAKWIWANQNWKVEDHVMSETIYCRRKTGKNVLR